MNWLDKKLDVPMLTEEEKRDIIQRKLLATRQPLNYEPKPEIDEMALKREVLRKMAGPDYSELDIGEQESPDIVDPTIENNQVSDDKLEMIRKILQSQIK